MNTPEARLRQLWGKTTRDGSRYHPALYHLLDVANVARHLLGSGVSPRWSQALAHAFGCDRLTIAAWMPWLVSLHDIGKVSALFQAQNAQQRLRLEEAGFTFGRMPTHTRLHHTVIGRIVLPDALDRDLPPTLATVLLAMIGGHHGVYNRAESRDRRNWQRCRESQMWADLRRETVSLLTRLLLPADRSPPTPVNLSAAIATLTGFTILCDWLGSAERFFPASAHISLPRYINLSQQLARQCVAAVGFAAPVQSNAQTSFAALFPGFTPRPLQAAADQIAARLLQAPSLTIVEAPTGEGKTEFALALARRIAALRGTDELYVALPTMATSNAMYPRIQYHLHERLKLDPRAVRLIHGQDFLVADTLRLELLDGGADQGLLPEWFAPKKRALLAPFGVGTVDQALQTVLNTRHHALRLIGLAGKVVILDEVHAYDTYMTVIIERLLAWLRACGASVILLSATLPLARRRHLLTAFSGHALSAAIHEASYPNIMTVSGDVVQQLKPAAHNPDNVTQLHRLQFADYQLKQAARWLLTRVRDGGCICWIANTVQRAQTLFAALRDLASPDVALMLLHARFPMEERQLREAALLARYGKDGERPQRGIVVGTQLLEQSLDVDFDVMVTDLAPIDLLLQREGRLHRHTRTRPTAHTTLRLYVNVVLDAQRAGIPLHDGIYDDYIMQRTWQIVRGRSALHLPADYRLLIESVYDETAPDDPVLRDAYDVLQRTRRTHREEAAWRMIGPPDPAQPFCDTGSPLFDAEAASDDWLAARTRLGRTSVTAIPLERNGDQAQLVPLVETVDLTGSAAYDMQLRLLKRGIQISQPTVVAALMEQSATQRTPLFEQSSLLTRCQPLWLHDGKAVLRSGETTITVRLDEHLGLCFER